MQGLIINFLETFYKNPEIKEQMRISLQNLKKEKREMSALIIETLHV